MNEEGMIQPAPQKRLFRAPQPGFSTYAWAYSEAASYLSKALKDAKADPLLALPCAFLYRHAIEVTIKSLLVEFGSDFNIQKRQVLKRGHNLLAQLDDLNVVAKSVGLAASSMLVKRIEELQKFDPLSFHSRYPESKEGKRLLSEEAASISFEVLSAGAEEVLDELMNIGMELDRHLLREILTDEGILD